MKLYGAVGVALFAIILLALRKLVRLAAERAKLSKTIPQLQGGGILGWFPDFFRPDKHRVVAAWSRQFDGIFFYRMLGFHAVVITDPHIASEVLLNTPGIQKSDIVKVLDLVLSGNRHSSLLTASTNAHWQAVRKAVAPAFSTANIRKAFEQTLIVLDQLIGVFEAAGPDRPVDIDNAAQRESLDVIGRVGFDTDFQAVTSMTTKSGANRALDALHGGVHESMARATDYLRFLKLYRQDVHSGLKDCKVFQEVVHELTVQLQKKPPADDTIAARLLAVIDPKTGQPLSQNKLEAEVAIMFLAGYETTGHTIAYALLMISQHPETEQQVLKELDGLGLLVTKARPKPRQLQWEDLTKMPLLSCAIKESMRMMPVSADGTFRINATDLTIGPHTIPAGDHAAHLLLSGVTIWVPFAAAFNHPSVWDAPDEFRPERWLDPEAEYATAPNPYNSSAKSKRFFPFSQGQRNCVGRGLAQTNYVATVAKLYSHFTFRLADDMGDLNAIWQREWMNLTRHVQGGVRMHCIPRRTLA